MAGFWDFDESDLVFNNDRSLAANAWVARTRSSGGEHERWFKWAVWDAETGEELASGGCNHTYGMWGVSGEEIEQIEFTGPRTLVVRYSEAREERTEIPPSQGKVAVPENCTRLSFWGTRLGPDLVAKAADSPQFRSVTELDLRGTSIGREGAKALATSVRLRRIEKLVIASTDVDEENLHLLRESFGDRLEVTGDVPPYPESLLPYFTSKEYDRAIARVSKSLEESGHDVATAQIGEAGVAIRAALRGGGPPPRLIVFLPCASVMPRDPATSFEIEPYVVPEGEIFAVVGLTLRCRRLIADRARPVLAQLQDALLSERGRRKS